MTINLSSREKKIIKTLLSAETYVSVENIANQMDVSPKTVRNDLENINSALKMLKIGEIIKKPRNGISLTLAAGQAERLEQLIAQSEVESRNDGLVDRKLYIIQKLLFSYERSFTMQEIATALYTSRSSVSNLLNEVADWFRPFGITLSKRQNYGIEIHYTELNWRKAAAEFYRMLQEAGGTTPEAGAPQSLFEERISPADLALIRRMLDGFDAAKAAAALSELERNEHFRYTYESYLRLVLQISFSIIRQRKRCPVVLPAEQAAIVAASRESRLAKELAQPLEKAYQVRFTEPEVLHLAANMLASDISAIEDAAVRREIFSQSGKLERFFEELTRFIDDTLHVNLALDENFAGDLLLHLRSAVYRLRFAIRVRNPFLAQIKEGYPTIYGAAWGSSVLFEKYFDVEVNEDEIGYLTLYISAAAQRTPEKVRAVVVCNHGIGISQLIAESVKRTIPDLEVVGVLSAAEYQRWDSAAYDLVISTLPLLTQSKPVVTVNSILKAADIERISEQIRLSKRSKIRQDAVADGPVRWGFFDPELIFVDLDAADKQEVIRYLAAALVKRGRVMPEFLQAALDRESAISTAVGQGIAIPHGNSQYVKRSAIAVARLKRPLLWAEQEKVDLVLLLAFQVTQAEVHNRTLSRFYAVFASLLDEPALIAELRSCRTPDAIYQFLTNTFNREGNHETDRDNHQK
jgi:transcriptional antiterminator/mannitol/fructose-specific phosphotransferase system IIA component (Ntr-type)